MSAVTKQLFSAVTLWIALACITAHAQLNISITGVGSALYPIAIANFRDENLPTQQVSAIIRADLMRSGRFAHVDAGAMPISETDSINLSSWKTKGADALVVGSVTRFANGEYDVRFRLFDTIKQQSLGGLSLVSGENGLRMSAHKAADYIYQKLLDERGVFATRLSYVVHTRDRYQLQIADADGQNVQVALTSPAPIISPAWSPDGTKLAYVSFERKKPVVYIHDLPTGQRVIISNQKGNNSAPAWSADGTKLAIALSLTGHTQIYLVNADGSNLHRLSNSHGIDTEPRFSPDGQNIYFTSDRGGTPQIYKMSIQGETAAGSAQRITFKGSYNTSPRISPDGKLLAMISRIGGEFKLYLQNLLTGEVTSLTDTAYDESPSFAANGKYLLYATKANGRNVIAVVSTDGRTRQILSVYDAEVRSPSWGPFIQ